MMAPASARRTGVFALRSALAVLMAAVSVYYYFRVIQAMYFREADDPKIVVSPVFKWTLVALAALVILLGIYSNLITFWIYF